jgi:hypothetical protein
MGDGMSEPKFTPGPWTLETVPINGGRGCCHKIGPFPSLGVYDETHACVYADGIRIGIEDRGGVSKVGDELAANARLIAAAPELYEALRCLLINAGEGGRKGRALDLLPRDTVEAASAALAKVMKP